MQNKTRGVSHVKLPSEGYRAIGGYSSYSIAVSRYTAPLSEPPADGNSKYLFFFVCRGLKLLGACLKTPALTGCVGDAQGIAGHRAIHTPPNLPYRSREKGVARGIAAQAVKVQIVLYPVLLCFCFWKMARKPPNIFLIPTEPLKSLEKKGKTLKETRNAGQKKNKEFQKKTRKDRVVIVLYSRQFFIVEALRCLWI